MKKDKQILLIVFFIIIIVFPLITNARSGCCSHHGGVCGCQCCDGTPLSVKCAPYYPQCSEPIDKNNLSKNITEVSNDNRDNSSFRLALIGSIVLGFIIYSSLKRK